MMSYFPSINTRSLVTIMMLHYRHHFSTAFEVSKAVLSNTENKCYVISSSSRGIGLEFTKQLLSRSSSTSTVIGLYRTKTDALNQLQLEPSVTKKLKLVYVDLESQDSILQATKEIQQITNKVDMLINTAGILGDGGKTTPGPERSLSAIDRIWMEKTMQVMRFQDTLKLVLPRFYFAVHSLSYSIFSHYCH